MADPEPATFNAAIPATEYAIFADDARGAGRRRLTSTRFSENHVIFAPASSPGAPFLIYQTYLADGDLGGSADGRYDEGDLANSAIAVMNVYGSRPRLPTDLDSSGRRSNNGAIDVAPEPSLDGRFIIFASNRHAPGSVKLGRADIAPSTGELDGDPSWGPDDKIVFKREIISETDRFSRVHTATIDTATMTLSNVIERTNGTPGSLALFPPGDVDPKLSPDGVLIASYRALTNPANFGDWDLWIGRFSDPQQPAIASNPIARRRPGHGESVSALGQHRHAARDVADNAHGHARSDRHHCLGARHPDRAVLGLPARPDQHHCQCGLDRIDAVVDHGLGPAGRNRLLRGEIAGARERRRTADSTPSANACPRETTCNRLYCPTIDASAATTPAMLSPATSPAATQIV